MKTTLGHVLAAGLQLMLSAALNAAPIVAGPMPGHVGMRSALIWLQGGVNDVVELEYWPADKPNGRRRTQAYSLTPANDHIVKAQISGLQPGTEYRYEVVVGGERLALGELRFHTQALWRWRSEPPDFSFALGSCAYINEPEFDRPGRPYGAGFQIFDQIAALSPAFMLWLGDNIYLREPDFYSTDGVAYRYRHARRNPALQNLLRGTHHVAVWDDHDFGPNNANRAYKYKQESLAQFKRYWPNPSFGSPTQPGTYTTFSYADAEFFLLDDRYYRDADHAEDLPGKGMFGTVQIRWLKNALLASPAAVKFIVSGSELLNERNRLEGWNHFAQERDGLLDWLARNQVRGVFFLSGDRHFTKLTKLPRADHYGLYELTCSPLTAGPNTSEKIAHNPVFVPGTVVQQRNFCVIAVNGPSDRRQLTVRSFSTDGKLLWRQEIPLRALR